MKKIIIPYKIDIFNIEILFCCCDDFQDVKDYVKKTKMNKAWKDEVINENGQFDGIVFSDDDTNRPYLIFVKQRKHDWYFYEVLLHETNHVVFYLAKQCGFTEEPEFQATLQEQLFREFRHLILKK